MVVWWGRIPTAGIPRAELDMTDTTTQRQPVATATAVARPYGHVVAGFAANGLMAVGSWSIPCHARSTHKPRPRRPQGPPS